MTPTPVSQWALDHKVELLRPSSTEEIAQAVEGVDCVVTIGYGVLLPESLLKIPTRGFLNLHFSLLPRWRGAAPVQRAIEAGDPVSGVTVFQLDAGMDTGPIYTVHRYALDAQPLPVNPIIFIQKGDFMTPRKILHIFYGNLTSNMMIAS